MRRALGIIVLAAGLSLPAAAQDEDGGSWLEAKLEELLSGVGRDVQVTGFSGALSSSATMVQMTISDDQGAWLTLKDVTLDWSRAALLRGRVEVDRLTAAEIIVARPPGGGDEAPAAEASGFKLPDLPVSVNIGEVSAGRLELGAPVMGIAAELSITGTLQLAGGAGEGAIVANRLDGPEGTFDLKASFDNATDILSVNLLVEEEAEGLVATLAGLPGAPSIRLEVTGEGPVSEFTSDLVLATDGEDRLTGRLALSPSGETGADTGFAATVRGDVTPLFLPAYGDFFGPDVALNLRGVRTAGGVLQLPEVELTARAIALDGAVEIGADGLPDLIDVSGAIASPDGAPVLLPLSGPETRVDRVELAVDFDAGAGDRWTGQFGITGLDRAGASADRVTLDGGGVIVAGATPRVEADFDFAAEALDLGDPSAEAALGEAVEGAARVVWRSGDPVRIERLELTGETYGLTGDVTVTPVDGGVELSGRARADARDLSVFSGLAGRVLAGRLGADVTFEAEPIAGLFSATLDGEGAGLGVGIAEVDRLMAGGFTLGVTVRRDLTGTVVDRFEAASDAVEATARLRLSSDASAVRAEVTLRDTGVIADGVAGPIEALIEAQARGQIWSVTTSAEGPGLRLGGITQVDLTGPVVAVEGPLRVALDDIAPFSARIGREVSGAVDAELDLYALADLSAVNLSGEVTTRDLSVGVAEADALLSGQVRTDLAAGFADEVLTVQVLDVAGPFGTLAARGTGSLPLAVDGSAELRLDRPGALLPGLPGPLSASIAAEGAEDQFDLVLSLDGPGTVAAVEAALDLRGDAPFVAGTAEVTAEDIAPFSELAGRALAGAVEARADGSLALDLSRFNVTADVASRNLSVGQADADAVLAGAARVRLDAERSGELIRIDRMTFDSPALAARVEGTMGQTDNALEFEARLASIERYLPGFPGALQASGRATQEQGGDWQVRLSGGGPGGINATVTGQVAETFDRVDLGVTGGLPLAAVNRFIEPRALAGTANFDLRVNGRPALDSVSGSVRAGDARFVAPALGVTVTGIGIDASLSRGRAQVQMGGSLSTGGQVSISGPVTLSGGFPADLSIALQNAVLTDPTLYETTVNGALSVRGALARGADIGGTLTLGRTEVQIPSTGISGVGDIPDLIHLNEPAAVRATRARAGLLAGDGARGGGGVPFPLDLIIEAPNQIFIRGRGLDAELGGRIRLRGTTANIIPSGQFELVRGRLDILGQRLTIDEGSATLQGDFDPTLRMVATTEAEDTLISIVVQGPASQPEILFLSEPDLPEDEVLARLLFGRSIESLSPLQAAQLAGAVATLAGRGGAGIIGNLRENFGLDDLDVTGDGEGGVGVRAGKYLSDNIYTDVTVGSTGDAEVSINLDLSPSVTVKGSVGSDGGTGLGVFFERDY